MCFFDFDTNWITSLFNAQKINIWSVSWIYKFFYFLFIKDINDKVNWHIFFLQGKHKQALSMANLTDISLFIRSDVMLLIKKNPLVFQSCLFERHIPIKQLIYLYFWCYLNFAIGRIKLSAWLKYRLCAKLKLHCGFPGKRLHLCTKIC